MEPAETSRAAGCVEILGGNESRAEALVLAGLELLLIARPAGAPSGGDFYCLHSCEDRALAKIVLVDVTGHGVRSAPIARAVHELLHRYSPDTQPSRLLDLMNQQFPRFAPPGILATSVCVVYDSRRGEVRYANGGQPRMLRWTARERGWQILGAGWDSACGLPFGVADTACYEDESAFLDSGDMLLMFSDGVPETRSATGGLLQIEGVRQLAQECTNEAPPASFPLPALAEAFLKRLRDFHGASDFDDDLTLLWVRRLPSEGPGVETAGV